jgi:hypothetical protein
MGGETFQLSLISSVERTKCEGPLDVHFRSCFSQVNINPADRAFSARSMASSSLGLSRQGTERRATLKPLCAPFCSSCKTGSMRERLSAA